MALAAFPQHSFSVAGGDVCQVAFVSGACDGELRVWDLAHRKCVTHTYGHARLVTGLTFANDGQTFFSCGDDNFVKQWALHSTVLPDEEEEEVRLYVLPTCVWLWFGSLLELSHLRMAVA